MLLTHDIAKVISSKTIWNENFSKPKLKWELTDDEDELAWMDEGKYKMKNLTEDRWNYYAVASSLDFQNDDYYVKATLSNHSEEEFSSFGFVFGFPKYFKRSNRFVVDASLSRVVVADFWNEDDSRPINRKSTRLPRKAKLWEHNSKVTMVILKVGKRISFFINDLTKPIMQVDSDFFNYGGDRLGFYIEPGLELWAENIIVKKLETEIVNEMNFELLLEDAI